MVRDIPKGDLSVTALYTSQVWTWGGLSHAHLFASPAAKSVFDATNTALGAARMFDRKLAPLRHSLLHRHTMIDHLLRESGDRHVIELAAGLSRRGAAATIDPKVQYTELDLPPLYSTSVNSSSAATRAEQCLRGRHYALSRLTSRLWRSNRSCTVVSRCS
jgi:hypothetical protein